MKVPNVQQITEAILSSKKGRSQVSVEYIVGNIIKKQKEKESIPAPVPNTDFDDMDVSQADTIINNNKVFVSYIRKKSDIGMGEPIACLVAFMNGVGMCVGWSLRNKSKQPLVQNVRGDIIKWGNVEPLPYTKKNGVRVAVLRAITDTIYIETERVYEVETFGTTQKSKQIEENTIFFGRNKHIPKVVSDSLSEFIERSQRWFKQNNNEDIINVSYINTVKNVEKG